MYLPSIHVCTCMYMYMYIQFSLHIIYYMQVFASEYYKHNAGDIIKSEDAAYVLSFAIMMLHTDLHNPSVKRHMTKKDWLRMNRGV